MWRKGWLFLVAALACGDAGSTVGRFDGARAFRDLEAQVAIGPRPSGSMGAERTRDLIRDRLLQAGWRVRDHVSTARLGGDEVEIVNLIATRPGKSLRRIWLGAHYDTKRLPGRFVGANDGASGVAALLEMARVLGPKPGLLTVELVFFDGEESFGPNITRVDGLYGSRALAREMSISGELESIEAFVLVDMVADRELGLTPDRNSEPWLVDMMVEEAKTMVPSPVHPHRTIDLIDDHTPFIERGLKDVVAVIDFDFPAWHTNADDLSMVSQESLSRVGALLVKMFARIERKLVTQEADTHSQRPG